MTPTASCRHMQGAEGNYVWAGSLEKWRVLAKREFKFLWSVIIFCFSITRWPPGLLLPKDLPKAWAFSQVSGINHLVRNYSNNKSFLYQRYLRLFESSVSPGSLTTFRFSQVWRERERRHDGWYVRSMCKGLWGPVHHVQKHVWSRALQKCISQYFVSSKRDELPDENTGDFLNLSHKPSHWRAAREQAA